jgi:hypothetical protein
MNLEKADVRQGVENHVEVLGFEPDAGSAGHMFAHGRERIYMDQV